jgi:serine/threonine-protein kinase RsbW
MKKMLQFNSTQENLRKVEKFVDELSSDLNLSSEIYGNLLIACLEAANNAVLHGNKLDESKQVVMSCECFENELKVTVKDEGKGFDYANIPDPTSPENIEKINGRGVFLMRSLSDKIEFSDNGRIVEMYFKLPH